MRRRRSDQHSVRLDKKRLPDGSLRVDAALTRTGIFEYESPGGSIVREYRPADEVFRESSLQSLHGVPVTLGHPPALLNPDTYRKHAIGHVADGTPRQDEQYIAATVYIRDRKALEAVQTKQAVEVSCGYSCDVEHTPGKTEEGELYDAVQRNIVYDHVALVSKGRAGANVRLRLDSEGNVSYTSDMSLNINGATYEVANEAEVKAAQAAIDRLASEQKNRHDSAQGRIDALEEQCGKLQAELDRLPEQIRAEERGFQTLKEQARKVAPEAKFDSCANARQVCELALGTKFDGRSDEYVRGRFDVAFEAAGQRAQAQVSTPAEPASAKDPVREARQRMIARNKEQS